MSLSRPTPLHAFVLAALGPLACAGDTFAPVPAATGGSAGRGGDLASGGSVSSGSAGSLSGGASGATAGGAGGTTDGAGGTTGGAGGTTGGTVGGAAAASGGGSGGSTGASGGVAGSSGASGSAGTAGSATSAGAAGTAGGAGKAGSAGAGGGDPTPVCNELPTGPAVMGFAPCNEDFSDCLLTTVPGTTPRLVATTCGLGAAYVPSTGQLIIGFPLTPGAPTIAYQGVTPAHTLAMLGQSLLNATGGDTLIVRTLGSTPVETGFAPKMGGGPEDVLGYRSLYATKEMVAWTGRQGAPVAWMSPVDFACKTNPGDGGCSKQILAPPDGTGTSTVGWGVTASGKILYWSHPSGVSRVDTANPASVTSFPIGSPTVPSSLATIGGRPLHAQANVLTLLPAAFDTPFADSPVPHSLAPDVEVRDLVLKDGVLYVLAARSAASLGGGSTTLQTVSFGVDGALQVPRVLVSVPAPIDPVSLAVGNESLFFAGRQGQIYRVKRANQ